MRDVLPLLNTFVKSARPDQKTPPSLLRHFSVPRFVYGDHDDEGAVLVLEDLSSPQSKSHATFDAAGTMLFDLPHMQAAVLSLSEFHGVTLAYDILHADNKLIQQFPIFHPKHLMWFQDDMLKFLDELTDTAVEFLDSIPGEQETARRYRQRMSDPLRIFRSNILDSSSNNNSCDDGSCNNNTSCLTMSCLLHGDSWHNNFMFRKVRGKNNVRAAIVDWQVSYYGNPLSDLCFLLYSSSTSLFRLKHADELLQDYFDRMTEVVTSLGVTRKQFNPTFRQFDQQLQNCLPLTLLFCGSAEDLKLREINDISTQKQFEQCKSLSDRRTSVATDQEIRALDLKDATKPKMSNPRIARSLRRRNYLDVCKEAVRRGVL